MIARLLLLVGTVACISGLAEVALRVVLPQQLIVLRPDIWRPDNTLGWALRHDITTEVNTGERSIQLRTDEQGFRISALTRPRTADLKILGLGDSFLEALQVEYEDTVGHLLERALSQHLRRGVRVVNTGVSGWDPNHYLRFAHEELRRTRYDAVLTFVYLNNDIVHRAQPQRREPTARYNLHWPERWNFHALVHAWLRPANEYLEQRSHLYVLAKNSTQDLRVRLGLSAVYMPQSLLREFSSAPQWDETAILLEQIHQAARSRNVPCLFVLIPSRWQVNPESLYRYAELVGHDIDSFDIDQPNRLLGERLRTRGLQVLDPTEAFRVAHQEGASLFGRVDAHLSPVGHAALSEAITPAVLNVLLDQAPMQPSHTARQVDER